MIQWGEGGAGVRMILVFNWDKGENEEIHKRERGTGHFSFHWGDEKQRRRDNKSYIRPEECLQEQDNG